MKGLMDLSRRNFFKQLTLMVFGILFPVWSFANIRKSVDETIKKMV